MSSDNDFERSSGNNTDDELDSPSRRNYDNNSKRRKSKSKQIPIKKGHSRSNSSELHARPSAENFSKHMSHVHKIETFTQLHSSHSPQEGIIDPNLLDNKAEEVVEQSSSAPERSTMPLKISAQNPKSNLKSVRRVLSDRKIRFSETKSDTDQEAARDLRSDSSSDKGSPPKFDRDMMFYSQRDEEISEDVQVLEYVDVHVKSLDEKFGMHKAVQMYVNFLQEIYTDIDEESIPKIVERYQKWLFMKSKRPEKLLYMPLDVLFIFSVHITFLSSWDKLSQTLFGKLRKPSDLGRRDENLLRPTNRKWLRYYGETLYKSPYWESSGHDVRAEFPNEWKQNIDIDLIAAAKDRLMFLRRLESELDLNQLTSKVFYKQSKKQYQEFLFKLYHPNAVLALRSPIDSEDEDDEDDVRLASRRKRGQNNDTSIEMKPITPRDKANEASSSDGEVSLSLSIGSPRDTSSRSSSQGKSASDPLGIMIKNAGGIQDVRPSSAVTELFWQTHLQNPKRYRKDLRALAKLAELLEEEKAKERRMFERRKRERDNMQRKSQERKRGESDRESDDLKSKRKNSNESSKKSSREVSSQKKSRGTSSSNMESLKSSIKSPESRHSINGHNHRVSHDRDDLRDPHNHRSSGHHSSRRNGNSSHHPRRQIQDDDDSDDDIEAGRPSHDYDETDDILVAAVSSKKVKSELVKRRSLIRTLGTVLFVITISIALAILVALAVGVSRGPIAQDWMALGDRKSVV